MYSREIALEKIQLALADAVVVFASAMVAMWLRHALGLLAPGGEGGGVPWGPYLLPSLLLAALHVLMFRYQGLYNVQYGRLVIARAGDHMEAVGAGDLHRVRNQPLSIHLSISFKVAA